MRAAASTPRRTSYRRRGPASMWSSRNRGARTERARRSCLDGGAVYARSCLDGGAVHAGSRTAARNAGGSGAYRALVQAGRGSHCSRRWSHCSWHRADRSTIHVAGSQRAPHRAHRAALRVGRRGRAPLGTHRARSNRSAIGVRCACRGPHLASPSAGRRAHRAPIDGGRGRSPYRPCGGVVALAIHVRDAARRGARCDSFPRDRVARNACGARARRRRNAIARRRRSVRTRVISGARHHGPIAHHVVRHVRVKDVHARAKRPIVGGRAVETDRHAAHPDVIGRQRRPTDVSVGSGGNSPADPRGCVLIARDPGPTGARDPDPAPVMVDHRTERVVAHPDPLVGGGEGPVSTAHVG